MTLHEVKSSTAPNRREFLQTAALAAVTTIVPPATGLASSQGPSRGEDRKAAQPAHGLEVQRLSWAGVKIAAGKSALFLDPWMSSDVWDGAWKEPIIPIASSAETKAVAITHLHNDHFDPPGATAAIGAHGRLLCHIKVAAAVAARGFEARGLETWQPYLIGNDIVAIPVPAEDGLAEFQVGWVVRAGGKTFFHGGDGVWHGHWHHIAHAYGPFDAVFLPINGVDLLIRTPLSHIPVSLLPEQAAAAAEILGAKVAVPIHYGITDPEYYIETPNAVERFLTEAKKRSIPTRIMKPGEVL